MPRLKTDCRVAFIGSAGIPNRYGGFEAFLEFCGPQIAKRVEKMYVTCDASLYNDKTPEFAGVERIFLGVRSNGAMSIVHDLCAFFSVFRRVSHIVVLGVSGAPWFPLFRLLCALTGKRLLVNVDGVEWRRSKFSWGRRLLLRAFDGLAQTFSHTVIYDNTGLQPFLLRYVRRRAVELRYSGDHVLHLPDVVPIPGTALTICRIEPENNIEMLIEGALRSDLNKYTIIGNWNNSEWGRAIRERYQGEPRLALLDPIYDAIELARLRGSCEVYLHGHSVGGTNPSLVEMLFYDCRLFCLNVPFHHYTVGKCASFFDDADHLGRLLRDPLVKTAERTRYRALYTAERIALGYVAALDGPAGLEWLNALDAVEAEQK